MTGRPPFHRGELAVQERAGVRDAAERAARGIRSAMPDQHRELFTKLPYLVVATVDGDGFPRPTILAGERGFVESPDDGTLRVRARPRAEDPAAAGLRRGAPIGVLGIELETRRRNRANGEVSALDEGSFAVLVRESFGNCPKYIRARAPLAAAPRPPGPVTLEGADLSARARAIVAEADALFVASASAAGAVDVSHRGGAPGFVRRTDAGDLALPDYRGNNFFMTLGNLHEEPRAGLAFVDFGSGDVLSLRGRAEIVWDEAARASFPEAQRLVRFVVDSGALLRAAVPFTWTPPTAPR